MHQITLEEFENVFSTNYQRALLYQAYLDFIVEIKTWGTKNFVQWLDGSFTTQNPQPNDIDIVTFLPFEHKLMRDKMFVGLKNNFKRRGLDCYFVKVYPPEHPDCIQFEKDKEAWLRLFQTDRDEYPKGIIQIDF